MSWLDVMVFSGLAFIIGCSVGVMIEIRMGGKEIDEIWRLHREGMKLNWEMQDEMTALIEKLEDENLAQHYIIESLGGYGEVKE